MVIGNFLPINILPTPAKLDNIPFSDEDDDDDDELSLRYGWPTKGV